MHWPGEEAAVVFVPATTSTHLISAIAALVLEVACKSPASLQTIAQSLNAAVDPVTDADEASQLSSLTLAQTQTIVDGLLGAGLLRTCP